MDFWVKVLFILSISMSIKVAYSHPRDLQIRHYQQDHGVWQTQSNEFGHHPEDEEIHDRHHAVLFAATRSVKNGPPKTGDAIVFDQVQLNREGGYDPNTGIFTCPEEGVFFFTFSFLPGLEEGDTTVALVKNDAVHERLYSSLPPGATQLSERSCLLRLVKGDRVWVSLEEGSVLMHQASLSFQGYRISS
ncbi:complement C1q tumor necrosis factor-related protein 3-like [Mobula hypostoma]|uniref:complement C1q tumor necrosis factor-related protein 3-like n=1 Tax=Mobula hypostoma TaxID=723540 RepID=UPI002FC38109